MRVWILPLSLAVIAFAYWKWARPSLQTREEWKAFYASCDSFWAALFARIRYSWLMILAVVSAVAPELPGWLTELGMLDLSLFLPSEWAFRASKIIALLAVVARIWLGTRLPPAPEARP